MRAKKIENKPIVNEVVDDAVEVKKMKKQISALESELKQHKDEIEKYERMQRQLDSLNAVTIRSSSVKSTHRRQTWGGAGDAISMIPIHVESPNSSKPNTMRDHSALKNVQGSRGNDIDEAAGSDGGAQGMETIDEHWTDGASVSFTSFKVPSKVPTIKRSLLAVSTSFKSPVHRTNCMLIADSFYCFSNQFTPKL